MTMNIQPGHIFLIAAKHDFMSQSIKTGSFVSFNFSNVKGEVEIDVENDECPTSASRNHTGDKLYQCEACHNPYIAEIKKVGAIQKYAIKDSQSYPL